MTVSPELESKAAEAISHYPDEHRRAASLPLLHLIQHEYGFVSEEAVHWVANRLDLEPIKILELVTFYPGFRQSEPGKFHIRVCRTLSCAMAGSYDLMETLCKEAEIDRSNVSHHHPIAVSKDGNFSIEFAECLASCGSGPVCMFNDDFHEDITPDKVPDLLAKYRDNS